MVHFEPEGGVYPAVGMAPFGSELSSRATWQKRTKIVLNYQESRFDPDFLLPRPDILNPGPGLHRSRAKP